MEIYRIFTSRGWLILTEQTIILESTQLLNREMVALPRRNLASVNARPVLFGLGGMQISFGSADGRYLNVHANSASDARTFLKLLQQRS